MWVYHTKYIKKVGGFPNKIMVLVETLGIIVPLLTKNIEHAKFNTII